MSQECNQKKETSIQQHLYTLCSNGAATVGWVCVCVLKMNSGRHMLKLFNWSLVGQVYSHCVCVCVCACQWQGKHIQMCITMRAEVSAPTAALWSHTHTLTQMHIHTHTHTQTLIQSVIGGTLQAPCTGSPHYMCVPIKAVSPFAPGLLIAISSLQ